MRSAIVRDPLLILPACRLHACIPSRSHNVGVSGECATFTPRFVTRSSFSQLLVRGQRSFSDSPLQCTACTLTVEPPDARPAVEVANKHKYLKFTKVFFNIRD